MLGRIAIILEKMKEHFYMIYYKKLFDLFEKNHMTEYSLKRDKIISQETYKKLKSGTGIYQTKDIYGVVSDDPTKKRIIAVDTKTIEKLCVIFNCQPSDIMEVIPNKWENQDKLCEILKCTPEELPLLIPMEDNDDIAE